MDTFALDEVIFVRVSGHFVFAAAVNHGDLFGTQPLGDVAQSMACFLRQ